MGGRAVVPFPSMASLWSQLQAAFVEGREEGEHGAPTALLLEVMVLAARADREVSAVERARIIRLATRHFATLAKLSETELEKSLAQAESRLDARGDAEAQLTSVARAVHARGTLAIETAFALAHAVLLVDAGVSPPELSFGRAFAELVGLSKERATEIERALSPSA